MVERMNSQIRGLTMATKNANDGIALIRTVENALVEVSGMLQRMRELAVQSANATNSATERAFANNELNQLPARDLSRSRPTPGITVPRYSTAPSRPRLCR
jgi:flagellin